MIFIKYVATNSSLDNNQVNIDYFSDNLLDCGDHVSTKLGISLNASKKLKIYQKKGITHLAMKYKCCPNCGSRNVSLYGTKNRDLIFFR